MTPRQSPSLLFTSIFILSFSACDSSVDMGPFSAQTICKATISTVMGQSPSIMSIDRVVGETTILSYVRPSDGKPWVYRCKLEDSRSIWASGTGRWRNHQEDSKITFSVSSNNLKIAEKFNDGSTTNKSFTLQQLGG